VRREVLRIWTRIAKHGRRAESGSSKFVVAAAREPANSAGDAMLPDVVKVADDGDASRFHRGVLLSFEMGDVAMSARGARESIAVIASALALCVACVASAQIPGLPSFGAQKSAPKADAAASAKAETKEIAKSRVDKLVEDFRADRERALPPPPEGVTESEAALERDVLVTLSHLNDRREYAQSEIARLRKLRADAEAAERDWTGISEPPPYSILKVDEWRDDADVLREHITAISAAIKHLDGELERAQAETKRADEALRRANDAREAASGERRREQEQWRRDLAELQLRTAGAGALLTRLAREAKVEDLGIRQAELKRLEKQIAIGIRNTRFDASDLAQARRHLADVSAAIARDRARLAKQLEERQKQRDAAAKEMEKAVAGTPERAAAEAKLRVAQAWLDTLRNENEIASGLPRFLDGMAQMWDQRRVLVTSADPVERHAAMQRIELALESLAPWRVYIEILVSEARAQLHAAESRLLQTEILAGGASADNDAVRAGRYTVAAYERVRTTIDDADRRLRRWVADGAALERQGDWRARALTTWLTLKDTARTVWEFELFAVEDTTVVDGQQVTISRGVTVGKSVGAFLLFLLGYWVIGRVARQVERWMVRRGLNPERVRTFRRWTVAVMSFALVLLTLNLARIPLSVFAFLGGALAIGVGFGMQTIIKNFISGMILLVERRVQIGDVIEIDGVEGTVTTVDLRSSTVRSGDGRETLVPNSVLLEHKVSNWTLSDRKVRRSVRVGVAYGTPMRTAAEKIEDCAKRHGNVLNNPPPQVLFDEFGESAQILTLYFWVEVSDKISSTQVASDLRFMIDKRFSDDGIVIAFPQRDVRVDPSRPIRVEMVAPAGSDDRGPRMSPKGRPEGEYRSAEHEGSPVSPKAT
jgi:small-conductance mechanosensitive channel